MRKDKEAYFNYVCPYCWNTLDNCICEVFPPYHLIWIDKNIQEHIRTLNQKGYYTIYCCEGHRAGNNTYITFKSDYFKNINTPDGFKYNNKDRTITYTYSIKSTSDEVEFLKTEKLAILLEWAKNLPNRDNK